MCAYQWEYMIKTFIICNAFKCIQVRLSSSGVNNIYKSSVFFLTSGIIAGEKSEYLYFNSLLGACCHLMKFLMHNCNPKSN